MKKKDQPTNRALVTLAVRISPELRRRVRVHCAEMGSDIQDVVREALEEYLKKRGA